MNAQSRTHEVKQGETLVSIAQAYQMTATELRALNKLPNERVEVGQKLLVRNVEPVWPVSTSQATTGVGIDPSKIGAQSQRDSTLRVTRSVEGPSTSDSTRAAETVVAISKSEPELIEREHLVQPGETLFGIANQYGMLVADLKRRNRIIGNDVTAGQRLMVLAPADVKEQKQEQVKDDRRPAEDEVEVGFDPLKHEWYIVKTSDTLPSIARNYGMSIAQLRELNGSMIYTMNAGARIMVFRKSGDDQPVRNDTTSSQAQIMPPFQQQPPVVELKPPVEHIAPPPVVSIETTTTKDSALVDLVVESIDPFSSFVNRGRFIGYIVKRNERLASILDSFQMDESDFHALNPSLEGRAPRAGVEVLVYEPPSNLQPNPYAVDAVASGVGMSELVAVYADVDKGKLTASGELYNPENLTVASATYPLGSILYIMNPDSGKGTYVRVNDKADFDGIIVSRSAASVLGLDPMGSNRVVVSKE